MTVTGRIAAVLGPALMAVTASETVNLHIWRDVHPAVVYLNGLLLLVGGLVIVTAHHRWRPFFGLLVTLSGWLLVAAGAVRMFFPAAQQLGPGPATWLLIASLFALGATLTAFAFLERKS
jgi:hypothetical protein